VTEALDAMGAKDAEDAVEDARGEEVAADCPTPDSGNDLNRLASQHPYLRV